MFIEMWASVIYYVYKTVLYILLKGVLIYVELSYFIANKNIVNKNNKVKKY